MKFNQLVVLFASASLAQAVQVNTGDDCSDSNSVCPSTDCCGTASKSGQNLKLCFAKGTSQWENPYDNNSKWSVSNCPAPAAAPK